MENKELKNMENEIKKIKKIIEDFIVKHNLKKINNKS